MSISIIIPTLNAERELPGLFEALSWQRLTPDEMVVVDSESSDRTVEIAREAGAKVLPVLRKNFDHGGTRDFALRESSGDTVVFLTQDAVPADETFLTFLVRPLHEERVAVVTGRQLPKADARPMEQQVRAFNYPAESHIRGAEDIERMGIKAFFCSDVCAAYNREIYLALGGFDHPLKTNEDMFFAAKALRGGYRVAYSAEAKVYHSHNFTLREQYTRNRIQGYEIERHRNLLGDVSKESEGMKLVKTVSGALLKQGRIFSFLHFGLDCGVRFLGSRAGKKEFEKEKA